MTVEDVEAVAAHLCGHHQILGGVGSSIGPGERAQRSDAGFIRVMGEFPGPRVRRHSPDHCCHPHAAGGFEEVLN